MWPSKEDDTDVDFSIPWRRSRHFDRIRDWFQYLRQILIPSDGLDYGSLLSLISVHTHTHTPIQNYIAISRVDVAFRPTGYYASLMICAEFVVTGM